MIYAKWLALAIADILLLPVWYTGAPLVSLFTRPEPDTDNHTWGGWFGTYDNPPQGDSRWLTKGWFPGYTTGGRGYLNRVGWLWRNPGYGFQKAVSAPYELSNTIEITGNTGISDKYGVSGCYFAQMHDSKGRLTAFEFYMVQSYLPTKCFRLRIGYKIESSKLTRMGFAPLVNTVHLYKQYGPRG